MDLALQGTNNCYITNIHELKDTIQNNFLDVFNCTD